MNDILKTYMERFRENRHTLRRYTAFVLALAMITTLFVNWQLHGVGISMTAQYQCGEDNMPIYVYASFMTTLQAKSQLGALICLPGAYRPCYAGRKGKSACQMKKSVENVERALLEFLVAYPLQDRVP